MIDLKQRKYTRLRYEDFFGHPDNPHRDAIWYLDPYRPEHDVEVCWSVYFRTRDLEQALADAKAHGAPAQTLQTLEELLAEAKADGGTVSFTCLDDEL